MTAKRALFTGAATPAKNAKRLRLLAAQVRRNTGELKVFTTVATAAVTNGTASVFHLTNIAQGDTDDSREGNQIRIYGIDARVHQSDIAGDTYIVLSPQGIAPVYTDFHAVIAGHITRVQRHDQKELMLMKNYNGDGQTRYQRRFKSGINTLYNGATGANIVRNRLSLVFKNNTAAPITYHYTVRIYFRE